VGDSVQVAGRIITVTELDGRRIARLRVTANAPPPVPASPSAPAPSSAPASPPASHNTVSAGQLRLNSEPPQEGDPR
jgi:hypothetical protein